MPGIKKIAFYTTAGLFAGYKMGELCESDSIVPFKQLTDALTDGTLSQASYFAIFLLLSAPQILRKHTGPFLKYFTGIAGGLIGGIYGLQTLGDDVEVIYASTP